MKQNIIPEIKHIKINGKNKFYVTLNEGTQYHHKYKYRAKSIVMYNVGQLGIWCNPI